MKKNLTISAIVTSYNQEDTIKDSILSLVDQKLQDVLVIDDASTDSSVKIIESLKKKYPIIRLIRNNKNSGVSKSLNIGFAASAAQYILIQGGDDISLPNRVETHYLQIQRFPKHAAHVSRPKIDVSNKTRHFKEPEVTEFHDFKNGSISPSILFINQNKLCAPTAILKREYFSNKIFNESLVQLQDFWLWINLAWRNELVLHDESVVQYGSGIIPSLSSGVDIVDSLKHRRHGLENNWIYRNFFLTYNYHEIKKYFPNTGVERAPESSQKVKLEILKCQYYLSHPRREVREIGFEKIYDILEKSDLDIDVLLNFLNLDFTKFKKLCY